MTGEQLALPGKHVHFKYDVSVSQELNRKSLMVEEAVEEVLDLVKKAAEEFKACGGVEEFDFLVEGKALCLYCGLLICDIVQWYRWI